MAPARSRKSKMAAKMDFVVIGFVRPTESVSDCASIELGDCVIVRQFPVGQNNFLTGKNNWGANGGGGL